MAPRKTLTLATAIALGLIAAPASGAATRYSAPGATGPEPCLESAPCEVEQAIEAASPLDEVILKPGNYAGLTSSIQPTASGLTIHGVEGQPRPALSGITSGWILRLGPSNNLRHVQIEQKLETESALQAGTNSVVSDVVLLAGPSGGLGFVGGDEALLRDSVIRVQGPGGTGVYWIPQNSSTNGYLRNVTVLVPGANSVGVRTGPRGCVSPCLGYSPTLDARNLFVRAERYDLQATTFNPAVASTLNVSYSNFRPEKVDPPTPGGGRSVNDLGHNQSAEPLFADLAGGDFHQLAGSPTIDAGVSDLLTGPTDFDGDPRLLGAAPDIGADEFVPPAGPGLAADLLRPVARALRLRPTTFRASARGPSLLAARRPVGARVSYSLSEAAALRLAVERPRSGRRSRGRCVAPNRRNRRLKRCVRYVALRGNFTHRGRAGANRFRFSGRLRGRKLRAGPYRLVGVPTDAAGNRGRPVRAKFRVVRR